MALTGYSHIPQDSTQNVLVKCLWAELYRELSAKFHMDIVASGGVSDMEDIRALTAMNLYGAIIGKAYYTGAIDLAEAIKEATT